MNTAVGRQDPSYNWRATTEILPRAMTPVAILDVGLIRRRLAAHFATPAGGEGDPSLKFNSDEQFQAAGRNRRDVHRATIAVWPFKSPPEPAPHALRPQLLGIVFQSV